MLYILYNICFTFSSIYLIIDKLTYFLTIPLLQTPTPGLSPQSKKREAFAFIFTDVTEVFLIYIKISIFLTIWSSIFFTCYQIWLFLKPGLYLYEKLIFFYYFISYFIYILLSTSITYTTLLPLICQFFLTFESTDNLGLLIHLEAKISEYLNFVIYKLIFWVPILGIVILIFFVVSAPYGSGKQNKNILYKRKIGYFFNLFLITCFIPFDTSIYIPFLFLTFCYEFAIFILLAYGKL
jgi:Sec-independent protein secretion pathway component TatC